MDKAMGAEAAGPRSRDPARGPPKGRAKRGRGGPPGPERPGGRPPKRPWREPWPTTERRCRHGETMAAPTRATGQGHGQASPWPWPRQPQAPQKEAPHGQGHGEKKRGSHPGNQGGTDAGPWQGPWASKGERGSEAGDLEQVTNLTPRTPGPWQWPWASHSKLRGKHPVMGPASKELLPLFVIEAGHVPCCGTCWDCTSGCSNSRGSTRRSCTTCWPCNGRCSTC